MAWVRYDKIRGARGFTWTDLLAPRRAELRYSVYAVRGTAAAPERNAEPRCVTRFVSLDARSTKLRSEAGRACSEAA